MTQMRSHNWLITSCIINEFENKKDKMAGMGEHNIVTLALQQTNIPTLCCIFLLLKH